jgi:DNA-binding transcriptional ArsR family regulator
VNLQTLSREHLLLEVGDREATLHLDGRRVLGFDVLRTEALDLGEADRVTRQVDRADKPVLVVFARSSPAARARLRDVGVSYCAGDGELFVFAPPIYVERPARRSPTPIPTTPTAPFAKRASRVPRWLLLHPTERPTFRELAAEVDLSEATVSRTVRALADDRLVVVESVPNDRRLRRVRLRNTRDLLDSYERSTTGRRPHRVTWDVGARDAQGALDLLAHAAVSVSRPYAVGGLAGAARIRRVVEPADVVVWIGRDDRDLWADALMAVPARPAPGRITAQLAPDPFVLGLTTDRDGIRTADPVQLYLDCRVAGERALDAAEAIRTEMDW